eukprot:gene21455-27791_t
MGTIGSCFAQEKVLGLNKVGKGISGLGEDDIQVNKMLCQTQFYTLLQTQLDTMLQTLLQTKLGTQLMPIKKALDYVVLDALDHWEKMHTETDSVVHSTNENNLAVSSFYGTNQSHYCMMLEALGLSANDISNPRNFLRLEKYIERAFNLKYLTFTQLDNSGNLIKEFAAIHNTESDYTFDQHKRPFLRLLQAALRKARQLIRRGYF